ncbi:hypothetical protein [Spirosoma rhododendri]|uniref:Uncharacterized protein n=1 Tax=Spirosoma rhododendri TaxID=2728024 RepID=A0A7L5DUM8_9BACT|nr:hypothetical protein [Spirosoma rhododendri]QJD80298.1 hypothetical protein HH216_19125 [Spirosoma rhododendri]
MSKNLTSDVQPVDRNAELEAQTCPRGTFKLSLESWKLTPIFDPPPNDYEG